MPRSRSRSLESRIRLPAVVGVAEDVRLLEQPVDQRRLAVVDVGDDGDVAQMGGVAGHLRRASLIGGLRSPWWVLVESVSR